MFMFHKKENEMKSWDGECVRERAIRNNAFNMCRLTTVTSECT